MPGTVVGAGSIAGCSTDDNPAFPHGADLPVDGAEIWCRPWVSSSDREDRTIIILTSLS